MTLFDAQFEFSDAQNIASSSLSSGSTVISTNTKDLTADETDAWGTTIKSFFPQNAGPLVLVCNVTTAFTGAGATVRMAFASKQSSASVSSSGTEHASLIIPALTAVKTQFVLPLPWVAAGINRYVAVLYTAVGGTLTAGVVDAFLAMAGQKVD